MAKIRRNPNALRALDKRLTRNAEVAGMYVVGKIQLKLSRTQPVSRSDTGRLRGLDPSKPGTAPKTVTGQLRQSIFHRVMRTEKGEGRRLRIGSSAGYARFLEPGTDRGIRNRQFLLSTIQSNRRGILKRLRKK